MTPIKTAQLLRELAAHIDDLADHSDPFYSDLVDRARAAAEEIEGRKPPTNEELMEVYLRYSSANNSAFDGFRGILSRFGGGEVGE